METAADGVPGNDIVRLNRTMQYGNQLSCAAQKLFGEFKSYYVVWKLDSNVPSPLAEHSFKSYYVVWKL